MNSPKGYSKKQFSAQTVWVLTPLYLERFLDFFFQTQKRILVHDYKKNHKLPFTYLVLFHVGTQHTCMVADLCHVVYACFRGINAKRRHAKTRKWWLVRVFAWRFFAPPQESTPLSMRCVFAYCLSYRCLAPGAKSRQAKIRQNHNLAGFRVATFRPAMQIYDTFLSDVLSPSICRVFARQGECSPRENTTQLKCRVFVFHFRSFAWRGARRKHFERHISCWRPIRLPVRMRTCSVFKYTLCIAQTIRHENIRPQHSWLLKDFGSIWHCLLVTQSTHFLKLAKVFKRHSAFNIIWVNVSPQIPGSNSFGAELSSWIIHASRMRT